MNNNKIYQFSECFVGLSVVLKYFKNFKHSSPDYLIFEIESGFITFAGYVLCNVSVICSCANPFL